MRKIFGRKSLVILALGLMPLFANHAIAQVPANCPDVMLQAFDYYPQPISINGTSLGWNESQWTTLNSQVAEIGASFQMIWLPPSGNAGTTQTMGYLPVYWFNQNSSFGTQANLKILIANLKAKNCKAIADIVINHRNGVADWCTFATESYNGVTFTPSPSWICTDDESRTMAPAGCNNPQGNSDEGEKYSAARDLDHKNGGVQAAVKAYLQFLKNDIGYSGWRYDVAAGYAPSHIGDYDDSAAGYFSVGEVMNCDYTAVETWINGTGKKSTGFDFPFQCSVRDAFNTGDLTKLVWKFLGTTNQPAGLIHNPDLRRYATTFIENHDTYRYGLGFYGNIEAGNAFMLSSPGVPCVYLPHWKAYKTNIQKMIAARKKAGIHSQSAVTVLQTASNIYVGQSTGTNGLLIVKVGSGSYSAPAGFTLECSGADWAIWTKASGTTPPTISVNKLGGTYIGGVTVTLSSTGGAAPVKIYYTLNGTTPTASSTLYSAPITITANNTTLKAIAIDNINASSAVTSQTYQTAGVTPITVKFLAPSNWSSAACYVWTTATPSTTLAGAWPGTAVSKDANGFYSFTINNAASYPVNVIFNNNNGGEQTVTLSASASTCWSAGTGSGTNPKTYTATAGSCGTAPVNVTGRFLAPTSWTTVKAYAWSATATLTAAWPGNAVTKDANGYYTYTMASGNNLIFNNGNNGQQTANITNLTSTTCWHTGTSTVSGSTTTFAVVVETCSTVLKSALISEEGVNAEVVKQISIFPNPARESFTIVSEVALQSVQIYSINGLLVKSVSASSTNELISISELVGGYYNIVAIDENGARFTSKLIKQ